jgi:hypothetical protein
VHVLVNMSHCGRVYHSSTERAEVVCRP